jgi:hypothetical protein
MTKITIGFYRSRDGEVKVVSLWYGWSRRTR